MSNPGENPPAPGTAPRLVVVSNRLPVRLEETPEGVKVVNSSGGLVTALNPILKRNRGAWIGWLGGETQQDPDELLRQTGTHYLCDLSAVALTQEEENLYYRGFANEALWPLFHDLLGHCRFDLAAWQVYVAINRRFAEVVARGIQPDDVIWIHDYQLALVGSFLRKMGVRNRLVYFLHIPFPSRDLFQRLPWRQEIIDGLLDHDILGFQTRRDRDNFVSTVVGLRNEAGVREGDPVTTIFLDDRKVRVGNWAISIDYDEFRDHARREDAARESWLFHEHFGERKLILGLDRLDYTKGIPERFLAFERMLEKYPQLLGKVCLYQCVVPSRTHVPDYQNLKETIDQMVGRINGRFSRAGWVPLHYVYRSLTRTELVARYHACEIALVTPLRDGMNLVCKEYIASCHDDRGVLVLSEFAGAAEELGEHALLVNPFDLEKTADTLYAALMMPREQRIARLTKLQQILRNRDVHYWVRSMFQTAGVHLTW